MFLFVYPGTESDMRHGLRGWLAGLGVLRGAVQPPHALACLAKCREGLSLAPDLCEYPASERDELSDH